MAAGAGLADLLEAGFAEGVAKAHEAVTGRLRVDGIGLDDFGTSQPRFASAFIATIPGTDAYTEEL